MISKRGRWVAGILLPLLAAAGLYCAGSFRGAENTPDGESNSSTSESPAPQKRTDRIVSLRERLREDPADSAARLQLGMELRPINLTMALEEFQKIPRHAPESFEARKQIAAISLLHGLEEQAEPMLQELHAEKSDDFAVELSLAELYVGQERYRDALPHLKNAIEQKPERLESHWFHASVLQELGRFAEMIEPLKNVLEIDPDHYEAHALLAFAYRETGNLSQARQHASWCLQREENDGFVHETAAALERESGNLEQAWAHAKTAMRLSPERIEPWLIASDLLMYQQKPEEAYQLLSEKYPSGKSKLRFLGAFARAASSSGHLDAASKAFEEIERIYERQMQAERSRLQPRQRRDPDDAAAK